MLGAIEVMSFSLNGQAMRLHPSHKNNKISETNRTAIWIRNVDSGTVDGNTISDYRLAGDNLASVRI